MAEKAESLHKKYEQAQVKVHETAPNTPERYHAMEAKREAFTAWKAADDAQQEADRAAADLEQKQAAAEGAKRAADDAKRSVQSGGDESGDKKSPVADVTAADAIEKIGHMRSAENLQAIVDADGRATVKDAAQKRLQAIGQQPQS